MALVPVSLVLDTSPALEVLHTLMAEFDEILLVWKGTPNMGAAEWAGKNSASEITGISRRARDNVRDLVQASFEEGWTNAQLVDELVDMGFDRAKAEVIGPHERRMALYGSRVEGWAKDQKAGDLPATARKKWVTGSNPCAQICRQVAGQTQFLDEDFDTSIGPISAPPAHPDCKCRVTLVVGKGKGGKV